MKITSIVCLVLLPLLSSVSGMQKIDGVVAFVGDSIILKSELEAYMLLKSGGVADTSGDSLAANILRHHALDELIDGKVLLVRAAKDTNIILTENEIDGELASRIQMIMGQNNLSPEEFEKILVEQQGISLAKFKAEVRKQIRQELLKQKVQQLYVSSGGVNRSDVERFYREYKDSLPPAGASILLSVIQITVNASDKVRQDAFEKIKAIKVRLDNGENFAEAARMYSDDPNAPQGGDLGFIAKGTLGELAFEEKAFSMEPGTISDVFETRLGFHIITVVDKKNQMVHVRQIFVPVNPPEDMLVKAQAILDSVSASAASKDDFLKAVRQFSTEDISKSRDGLLGWQELSSLDPGMRQVVDSLPVGTISRAIRNDNRFSVYRVDDKKDSRPLTLEDDWAEISAIAQRIQSQMKLIDLVKKWRQETFIDVRL